MLDFTTVLTDLIYDLMILGISQLPLWTLEGCNYSESNIQELSKVYGQYEIFGAPRRAWGRMSWSWSSTLITTNNHGQHLTTLPFNVPTNQQKMRVTESLRTWKSSKVASCIYSYWNIFKHLNPDLVLQQANQTQRNDYSSITNKLNFIIQDKLHDQQTTAYNI